MEFKKQVQVEISIFLTEDRLFINNIGIVYTLTKLTFCSLYLPSIIL